MNFRSRDLLDACYQFNCLLAIPGVCEGGNGEPCHANWPEFGKGMGIKAHDNFAVPGCRACHRELDQGSHLSGEERRHIWLRAFLRYQPMLWQSGLLAVTATPIERTAPRERVAGRRRKSRCTASSKNFPRNPTQLA